MTNYCHKIVYTSPFNYKNVLLVSSFILVCFFCLQVDNFGYEAKSSSVYDLDQHVYMFSKKNSVSTINKKEAVQKKSKRFLQSDSRKVAVSFSDNDVFNSVQIIYEKSLYDSDAKLDKMSFSDLANSM